MANVTPGYTFSGATDLITAAKLNLISTPTVAVATGEVTAAMCATSGIGYAAGGGTVTQATGKYTGVTLNTICGSITLNDGALGAQTVVWFTLTNSRIAATDILIWNHSSVGTVGAYVINSQAAAGSAVVNVTNVTSGSLGEAIVIRFAVIKSVNA